MGNGDQAAIQADKGGLGHSFWPVAHTAGAWAIFIWSFICFYGASDNVAWRWLVILGWPVAVWVVVVVHELGHAAATWAAGWRVVAIATGPIAFHLVNRDFAIVPRSKRTEFEGFVVPIPKSPIVWTIPRKALISAGGPLANILLAVLLFAIFWGAPEASLSPASASPVAFGGGLPEHIDVSLIGGLGPQIDFPSIVFGAGLVSLWIGLSALMPAGGRDQSETDGDHLIGMMRLSRTDWLKYRAYSYLRTLLEHQVRLRDLPLWILDEASEIARREGGAFQQSHETMIIGMVLDSPPVDLGQGRSMLNEYRDRYGASEWLNGCDAYFTAVWEGDAKKARLLLWRGERCAETRALSLAAEAAVQAREGDAGAANALLHQMRQANRERSVFPDHTFRDIGRQIEAILPR